MKFCLIGSSRFKELYTRANRELTGEGHVVYSIAWHSSDSEPVKEVSEELKMVLDLVHLRKIQESEASILITDDTGYFGFSTRREIIWCSMLMKPLFIYIPRDDGPLIAQAGISAARLDKIVTPVSVADIIRRVRNGEGLSPGGYPMAGGEA